MHESSTAAVDPSPQHPTNPSIGSERSLWVLLGLIAVVGIVAMPKELYPGDPFAMREETRAILLHGELAVERSVVKNYETTGEPGQYVVDHPTNGRAYSKYGSMAAWMYLIPLGFEKLFEGELPMFVSPRRVLYLNLFNIALSLLVGASLYRTARRFGGPDWLAAAFVALCFYTTFLWNYLRAQNSEIMQLLFFAWTFTAFMDMVADRRAGRRSRAVARFWLACGVLLLTKVQFILVGPLFVLALLVERLARGERFVPAVVAEAKTHFIPQCLVLGAWAWLNAVKFGSPFRTGYHAHRPDVLSFIGDPLLSTYELLTSSQWGLVYCFPVLGLALPFAWKWLRRWPVEYGAIVLVGAVYTLLLALMPAWTGQWCYGPRYWVFVLPFAALPAIDACAWLTQGRRLTNWVCVAVAIVLLQSTFLQLAVNRHPFFALYHLRIPIEGAMDYASGRYFTLHSYGRILGDYERNRNDLGRFDWWAAMKPRLGPDGERRYGEMVRQILDHGNLYWFDAAP